MSIGIGVVGCGYWGPNLIRNFRSLAESRMKVMCDVDRGRLAYLQGLYPEIETTTTFQSLLDDKELAAVVVATSVRHHYSMVKAALLAGKHVLVEKPMATSTAECAELLELATQRGLTLMVGHTFLYSPAVQKIQEIVKSGQLGTIRYISARRLNLGLFQRDINVAWDLAPHDLSIILSLMGEMPREVTCRGSAHITPGVEDVTSMFLQFSQERSALIHSSWLDPRKVREMTIVGSRQMVVYDDVQTQEKIRIFDMRVDAPPHYDTFAEFHFAYHYGDIHVPYVRQEEPLKNECRHFLECIQSGQTPLTSGRSGADVVEILEAASRSLKNPGTRVTLVKHGSL